MRRNGWTEYEDSVVLRYYPLGGSSLCYPRLSGRTLIAIENHAAALGVKYEAYRPKRPVATSEPSERVGNGPGRYRYQWEPLKPVARPLTREGADDWKTVPSLR